MLSLIFLLLPLPSAIFQKRLALSLARYHFIYQHYGGYPARLFVWLTRVSSACRQVANTLPRGWFQSDVSVPQLAMFVSYLSMLAVQLGRANKT